MSQLDFIPTDLAKQSISRGEIVLPLDAALAVVDHCEKEGIQILGWEGWIQTKDGHVGHGNAPQGTVSLEDLSIHEAAEFSRQTIIAASREWHESHAGSTDQLHFCITVRRGL